MNDKYEVLFEQQEGKCALCSEPLTDRYHTQIDHIIRQKDNGPDDIENLRLICLPCDWEREGNKPNSRYPTLMTMYRMYKLWQTEAGRMDRKIKASMGDIAGTTRSPYFKSETMDQMDLFRDTFKKMEKIYEKAVRKELKEIEVANILIQAYGAGPLVIAHIMSCFDIRKGDTVSSMWKFFGYDPGNSAGAKGRNPGLGELRAPIYASLSITLIRNGSPYRAFYDSTRKKLEEKGRDKVHGPALQRTIKLWLSHLWATWREIEGLEVTKPYAHSQLGHDSFISPESCGWKSHYQEETQSIKASHQV